jgi:hypothetical protein
MPTTSKGLPYPAATAPPNVPADLAALAEDLDFTKILLLPASLGTTSLLSAYPLGVSLISLSTAEAGAGGWPSGASGHVLTIKPTTTRAAQWFFRNTAAAQSYYRNLVADPGPHTPWIGGAGHYGSYVGTVVLNTSTNPTAAVVLNWPVGRFSVAPRVVAGSNSTLWMPSATPSATNVTVIGRNVTGTTGGSAPTVYLHAIQATSASADTD